MQFYDVLKKRTTIREFTDTPIPEESVRRIIEAALRAPSNDHLRQWEFVVVTDKTVTASLLSDIPQSMPPERLAHILKTRKLHKGSQHAMYEYAIPQQYAMLYEAGCLILPLFRSDAPLLEPKTLSSLNAFASIWCCIENMLLAATCEGLACAIRIPSEAEQDQVRKVTKHPANYTFPCFVAVGYPAENAVICKQKEVSFEDKIHRNRW